MADSTVSQSSYRVLARRCRPQGFSELIGQEGIVSALTRALTQEQLPHAFLLTGIRGVGKTTIARILARCLNCEKGPTPDPCGVCASCTAIAEDRHIDVIEMDAASHTGVDDIRELVESGRYKAIMGNYKVYIIDEAHMLSKSAFNALLKTLEEPPPHLVFILATTEKDKVPVTVLSRCMRCELKRVHPSLLQNHLMKIAETAGADLSEEAAVILARAAEGSVRDALSLLDQALLTSHPLLTRAAIEQMLGMVDKACVVDLFEALVRGDLPQTLTYTKTFYRDGADSVRLLEDLLELIYTVTYLKASKREELDMPAYFFSERPRLEKISGQLTFSALMTAWQHMLLALEEVQAAPMPLLALEMSFIRLLHSVGGQTPETDRSAPDKTTLGKTSGPKGHPLVAAAVDVFPQAVVSFPE